MLDPARGRWATRVRFVVRRRTLVTTLSEIGAVAVQLAFPLRAEPLSQVPSPHWDALVAAGELNALSPAETQSLVADKWSDPLLGVAGAYACFTQGNDTLLATVLKNLERVAADIPDVTLLKAALDRRRGRHDDLTRSRLERLESPVPLFRWGVAIGALGASHYKVPTVVNALKLTGPTGASSSIWTLWEDHEVEDYQDGRTP